MILVSSSPTGGMSLLDEHRLAVGAALVAARRDDAVAVGVDRVVVGPVALARLQAGEVELARRDDDVLRLLVVPSL